MAWTGLGGGGSVGDASELRLGLFAAFEEPSVSWREDVGMSWVSAADLDFNLLDKYLHSTSLCFVLYRYC